MIPDIMTQSEMIGVLVGLLLSFSLVMGTMIFLICFFERPPK
jgi:hypothetical protein